MVRAAAAVLAAVVVFACTACGPDEPKPDLSHFAAPAPAAAAR